MAAPLYASGGTEGAVAAKGRQYAARGVTLSAQEAMDEIAADFTEALVAAPGRFEALVRADRGVAGRILDAIIDFIAKVKAFFSGKKTWDTTAFGVEFSALEEAALLWQKAYDAAAEQTLRLQGNRGDGTMSARRDSIVEGDRSRDKFGKPGTRSASGQTRFSEQRGDGEIPGTSEEKNGGRSVSGRPELLAASFGESPIVDWAKNSVIEPSLGSVAYAEQLDAQDYHIPSFVISDQAWDDSGKKAPAFSTDGQIYLRETLDEHRKGMYVIHEATHVMKQLNYGPYMEFIGNTKNKMDLNAAEDQIILEHAASHRNIDIFGSDGDFDIQKLNELTAKDRITLFDELNAIHYGHIGSGKYGDSLPYFKRAFYDFDAYASDLASIHDRFRRENGGGKVLNENYQ